MEWEMPLAPGGLFPAHAGVIPVCGYRPVLQKPVPRTRGGDPFLKVAKRLPSRCSPHTRG